VDATHKIHVKVPLHFVNAEVSPAVKLNGGIISHVATELDISCLPGDLPEFVEVDLSNMDIGHSLHLKDIKLPKGVSAVQHGGDDNPTIATASIPAGKVEAAGEAAAAPEGEADKK
ncbi:MAG TPA: 50S ribosomal protein L25, partial [Oxalicibacterium sp.]|nr:50S ribosomal protein L25 [Oxalicibacterium sp.]